MSAVTSRPVNLASRGAALPGHVPSAGAIGDLYFGAAAFAAATIGAHFEISLLISAWNSSG